MRNAVAATVCAPRVPSQTQVFTSRSATQPRTSKKAECYRQEAKQNSAESLRHAAAGNKKGSPQIADRESLFLLRWRSPEGTHRKDDTKRKALAGHPSRRELPFVEPKEPERAPAPEADPKSANPRRLERVVARSAARACTLQKEAFSCCSFCPFDHHS